MITADIIDQGTINTTLPSPGDPTYQVESLALFYRQQWAALRTAGFNFARPQTSDFSTFQTGLETYLEDAYDRETEIINDGVATTVAALPDILAIGSAFVSGGASAVGAILLEIILGKLIGGDSGARAGYRAGEVSPDMTEVVDALEEIRDMIETILTEFNINLYSGEYEQSWSVGPVSPD